MSRREAELEAVRIAEAFLLAYIADVSGDPRWRLHCLGASPLRTTKRRASRREASQSLRHTAPRDPMKNITLSADEVLIDAACERARAEYSTLNEQFRRWLADYARPKSRGAEAAGLLKELRGRIKTGSRTFSRDERNER